MLTIFFRFIIFQIPVSNIRCDLLWSELIWCCSTLPTLIRRTYDLLCSIPTDILDVLASDCSIFHFWLPVWPHTDQLPRIWHTVFVAYWYSTFEIHIRGAGYDPKTIFVRPVLGPVERVGKMARKLVILLGKKPHPFAPKRNFWPLPAVEYRIWWSCASIFALAAPQFWSIILLKGSTYLKSRARAAPKPRAWQQTIGPLCAQLAAKFGAGRCTGSTLKKGENCDWVSFWG